MKLIKPYYEIWEQSAGLEGIYKQIERAGKICYKSEHTIKDGSAKPFVDRLINSKHLSVLEHGTLYFKVPANIDEAGNFLDEVSTWTKCKLVKSLEGNWWAITTNLRVMIEHFATEYIEDLIEKYLCEPTEFHEKRVTVHFVADIGVIREFFRHRVFSMAQESTRYCNYSKDKFGNEITFIIPCWANLPEGEYGNLQSHRQFDRKEITSAENSFLCALLKSEDGYFKLLKEGWKPQEARAILPLCTKGEAVMTGFVSDWQYFFDLRVLGTTGAPHPQAKELAEPLMKEFIARKYINN